MEGHILAGLLLNLLFWISCLAAVTGIGIWVAREMFPDLPRRGRRSRRGARQRGNRRGTEEVREETSERPRKAA